MNLAEYYSARAEIYDEIYQRQDLQRQRELEELKTLICNTFSGRHLLEIACGTGYWTTEAANVAASVVAVDASDVMLKKAKERLAGSEKVRFQTDDAYLLNNVSGTFNSAMAFCWFSHVPKERREEFISNLHRRLKPGSPVLLVDNSYVEGLGGELLPPDDHGNTYKMRKLGDRQIPVLKNYFSERELCQMFNKYDPAPQVKVAPCFWSVLYRTS